MMVSFVAKEIMNTETASAVDAYLNQVKPEGSELKKGLESRRRRHTLLPHRPPARREEVGRTLTFERFFD